MAKYVIDGKVSLGSSYDYDDAVSEIASLIGVGARPDGKIYLADLVIGNGISTIARNKPFDYPAWNFASNAARNDARNNNSVANGFGATPMIAPSGTSIPHAVYEYKMKPKGGVDSPARIRDFDGYWHNAVSPISIDFPSYLKKSGGNGFTIFLHDTSKGWDADTCLRLHEMLNETGDALYYALLVRKGSQYYLMPTSEKVYNNSTQRVFTIVVGSDSANLASYQGMSDVYPISFASLFVEPSGTEYEFALVASRTKGANAGVIKEAISTGIGDQFSLEFKYGVDRKTITINNTAGTSGVTGSLNTTFSKSQGTASNGYVPFNLTGTSLKVRVKTPSGWSGSSLYVIVKMSSTYGYLTYKENGATYQTYDMEFARQVNVSSGGTTDVTIATLTDVYLWVAQNAVNTPAINYTIIVKSGSGVNDGLEIDRQIDYRI